MDIKQFFLKCVNKASAVIAEVDPEDMDKPTPDTEWKVRDLVGHMLYELQWTSDILAGKTIEQVGDKYSQGGHEDSLMSAWRQATQQAQESLSHASPTDTAHLSYGDATIEDYLWEAGIDQLIHSWDLGEALGARVVFDEAIATAIYDRMLPRKDDLAASGLFAPAITVDETADIQTKLLALYGREARM